MVAQFETFHPASSRNLLSVVYPQHHSLKKPLAKSSSEKTPPMSAEIAKNSLSQCRQIGDPLTPNFAPSFAVKATGKVAF